MTGHKNNDSKRPSEQFTRLRIKKAQQTWVDRPCLKGHCGNHTKHAKTNSVKIEKNYPH